MGDGGICAKALLSDEEAGRYDRGVAYRHGYDEAIREVRRKLALEIGERLKNKSQGYADDVAILSDTLFLLTGDKMPLCFNGKDAWLI